MKTIWKYEVRIDGVFKLTMPKGAEIIAFQTLHGAPTIWAIVNTEEELTERVFSIRGTGHPFVGKSGKYLGTIQVSGGSLIWHLFEIEID